MMGEKIETNSLTQFSRTLFSLQLYFSIRSDYLRTLKIRFRDKFYIIRLRIIIVVQ